LIVLSLLCRHIRERSERFSATNIVSRGFFTHVFRGVVAVGDPTRKRWTGMMGFELGYETRFAPLA